MKGNRFGGEIFSENDGGGLLDGMANLADVMLVLAVGFMLALIINWNVDIAPTDEQLTVDSEQLTVEETTLGGEETPLGDETQYEELDVAVYRDPATGKLYMVNKK
jgi:hypothetical protein